MAEATRVKGGEMGWILETNKAMNRAMEAMGGEIVKKYRVYERVLHVASAGRCLARALPYTGRRAGGPSRTRA